MNKTFVAGDIHGAFKALEQVLEKINFDSSDRLVFLGDYVDGWSQSFEVISFLLELEKKQPCVFIKGNHDAWCQEWMEKGTGNEMWLMHGGQETVESYTGRSDMEMQQHLQFFQRMKDYFIDEDNRLYVHAGFASVRGPANERYSGSYSWDRTLWETALSLDSRIDKESNLYPKRFKLFKEIYIGHTPTIYIGRYDPVNAANVWNLDTGAAFDGKLSVMDVDTKEYWQSDTVQELFPGERGRN